MVTKTARAAKKTPRPARPKREPTPTISLVIDEVVDELIATTNGDLPIAASGAVHGPDGGKQKLVRDGFTMPKNEYQTLDALKVRLLKLSHSAKKGELLRAGIGALARMSDADLLAAVTRIPNLKTGRPRGTKTVGEKSSKKS